MSGSERGLAHLCGSKHKPRLARLLRPARLVSGVLGTLVVLTRPAGAAGIWRWLR
jgi:hypothetical protein